MKNRKSTSETNFDDHHHHHNDKQQKSSSSRRKRQGSEVDAEKRKYSTLLEKSSQLLDSYNTLLKGSVLHCGETDAYFKKSLRNYTNFELPIARKKQLLNENTSKSSRKSPPSSREAGDSIPVHIDDPQIVLRRKKLKTRPYSTRVARNELLESKGKALLDIEFKKLKNSVEGKIFEVEKELLKGNEKPLEEEVRTDSPVEDLFAAGDYSTELSEEQKDLQLLKKEAQVEEKMADPETEPPTENPDGPASEGEVVADDDALKDTSLEKDLNNEEPHTPYESTVDDDLGILKDDVAIMKEVEECEAQCMEIYKILSELKKRVSELLSKAERTDQEDQELETKQKLLNEKMVLLEQKTNRIQLLVTSSKKPDFDKKYDEDTLPKVVVCGVAENNMPKFIICDDKKRAREGRKPPCSPLAGMSPKCPMARSMRGDKGCRITLKGQEESSCPASCRGQGVMPQIAQKLSDSYLMQERLLQDNIDLECKRFQLQEDLYQKDQSVDCLQRQLTSLQTELRMVVKENGLLNSKLQQVCPGAPQPMMCQPPPKPMCPKALGGVCPAEQAAIEEAEKRKLEKQLLEMEAEVKAIQNELSTVRNERIHLEQHRRMLSPIPPLPTCPAACMPCPRGDNTQLKELREQYNTLQDDYKSKMVEVSGLRADIDKLKNSAQLAIDAKKLVEERVRELERQLKDYRDPKSGAITKEMLMEMEQQVTVAKQRFRAAQDELDEIKSMNEELQQQVNEYRDKYMEAQQNVEEQRRQIDLMELENNRIGEQVNLEIQRVKNQFQEKLQELTPLPDILKTTQIKLQEAQQMHMMAERNNEALLREIQSLRDRAALIADEVDRARNSQANGDYEKQTLAERLDDMVKEIASLKLENDELKSKVEETLELAAEADRRAQEKLHEIVQLQAEADNAREEAARVVARTKDRCETIRRSMQNQVADLEKQLAHTRAQARSAQKDRDEIRQKMQMQINNLHENFEDAQMRIQTLQGHVNFLKSSAGVPLEPMIKQQQ